MFILYMARAKKKQVQKLSSLSVDCSIWFPNLEAGRLQGRMHLPFPLWFS